jgi:hypothetical protein
MDIDDDYDNLSTWEIMKIEDKKLIVKEVLQHELPTFEDKSVAMNHASYDKNTKNI